MQGTSRKLTLLLSTGKVMSFGRCKRIRAAFGGSVRNRWKTWGCRQPCQARHSKRLRATQERLTPCFSERPIRLRGLQSGPRASFSSSTLSHSLDRLELVAPYDIHLAEHALALGFQKDSNSRRRPERRLPRPSSSSQARQNRLVVWVMGLAATRDLLGCMSLWVSVRSGASISAHPVDSNRTEPSTSGAAMLLGEPLNFRLTASPQAIDEFFRELSRHSISNIDPVALQLGPVTVKWYGLAYMAGLLLGWLYIRRLMRNPAGQAASRHSAWKRTTCCSS